MIPVDHEMAVKKRWNMPFPGLLERLREKASGRVLRIDDEKLGDRPDHVPPAQWKSFEERVQFTDRWIEYTIPLDD
jgi:hypothetical protein